MTGTVWIILLCGAWALAYAIGKAVGALRRRSEAARLKAAQHVVTPAERDEMWRKAREIPHGYAPNWVKDAEYLSLVYKAAEAGHVEAMAKLGEIARRKGRRVEAYYWYLLADLHGSDQASELATVFTEWVDHGCHRERDNVSRHFSERLGKFARSAMRVRGGFRQVESAQRVRRYAESGLEAARLLVERDGE